MFREPESEIEIGAALTLSEIERLHRSGVGGMADAVRFAVDSQPRDARRQSRDASPIGDAAPLLLALDARCASPAAADGASSAR